MLKKNEIVFYTEDNYNKEIQKKFELLVGLTQDDSIQPARMVDILPLKQQSDGNLNDWVIDTEISRKKSVGKNNIFYVIKNKQILGEVEGGTFLVSIDGKAVKRIFELWRNFLEDEEDSKSNLKSEKIGGKMLRKRKKRKRNEDEVKEEETEFEIFLSRKKYKIGRERQLEILPSFRKIASTNLRYGKEKDENGDIFLNFGSRFKKKIRKRRKLSLDIVDETKENRSSKKSLCKQKNLEKIHFIEYLAEFIQHENFKVELTQELKNSTAFDREVPNPASKFSYLNLTSQKISHFYENLRELEKTALQEEIDSLCDLNKKMTFAVIDYSVRLILSFSMPELHHIRDDLFLKNPEISSKFKMENVPKIAKRTKRIYKGVFILENLLDFIENLAKHLHEEFLVEYFEFIQHFCFLIIGNLQRVSKLEMKRDHKKNHLIKIQIKIVDFNFRLFGSLFNFKGTEKIQLNILKLIISQIKTTKSFSIQGNQPLIAKRLNKFYNDKLNQTPKKWNIFVDSCVEVILEKRNEFSFDNYFKNAQKMEYFTGIMLSIQTSLAKGYYTGLMRVVIQKYIEKGDFSDLKKQIQNPGEMEDENALNLEKFMLDLLTSNEKLPVFVYFARCLQHYYGDLKKIACKHEISPLEVFTQRYMTEDEEVQVEDFKYIPIEYRQYVDGKKRLNYLIQAEKDKEFFELVTKNLSGFSVKNNIEEKESVYVERYNFWLIFLNDFYITYLVDQQVNFRNNFREKVPEIEKLIQSEDGKGISSKHFSFMKLLITNFNGNHRLSLKSSDSKEIARTKITIVHTMLILMLTKNKFMGVFSDELKPYFKRGQLAAYPSKKEINLLLIASTFNNLSGDWRTGQQFTRLYRCSCSYLYWIGDCGRAWVIAKCPNCGMDIGGEKHKLVNTEKGGKEITKDIFFKNMYGPLEKKSGKVYHLRTFNGKYSKLGKDNDDEKEEKMEKNETDLMMEIEPALKEKDEEEEAEEMGIPEIAFSEEEKFEVEVGKAFTPLRGMDKISIFCISEFLGHVRYLLEIFLSNDEIVEEQSKYLGLDTSKNSVEEYLFDVLERDYERIQADEWKTFNPEQFFRALNILLESSIGDNLNKKAGYSRNHIERLIRSEYEDKKDQIADYVVQRIQLKKNLDKTMSSTTKLTKDWMSNLVALDDFKGTEIDLKLVSGMRMKAVTNLEKFKDWLKIHIHRENLTDEMRTRMHFVKRVIELKNILKIVKFLIGSHIKFCQFLKSEFEYRISYKQACSLSIEELLEGKLADEEDDKHNKLHLIKNFSKKEELLENYSNLVMAWNEIMKNREEYADLFNFRFLCHAQELPEEKIDLIFNQKSAKLIYFLPSGKYVESLFMSSAIPTLAAIQNDFLKNSIRDFFRVNFKKPRKVNCLDVDPETDLMSMSHDIKHYLDNFTYTDLSFNKDFQVVYDMDLMAKDMARDIMKEACYIESEGDDQMKFVFGEEFSPVYEKLKKLEIQKGWEWIKLDKEREDTIEKKISVLESGMMFEIFAGLAKKLRVYCESEEEISKDECLIFEGECHEKVIEIMSNLKLKRNEIIGFYHILEKIAIKPLLESPLPQLKFVLSKESEEGFVKFWNCLDESKKERFKKIAVCLYLTRIVGTTNENIGEISVKDCMMWSDILLENEDELEFLNEFNWEFKMKQLYGILKLILEL